MAESSKDIGSAREKRKAYRDQYELQKKELLKDKAKFRREFIKISDIIVRPDDVDMKSFCGTEDELVYALKRLYANDGRDFNPEMQYPPCILSWCGKDYALHARGIYYRDSFSKDLVRSTRKVWTPSLSKSDSQSPEMLDQQARALALAKHSKDNERWCKSEYAWEADAWSDVFRPLRDDPCLTLDKHEYVTLLPDNDPVNCHLTGTSTLVHRTPDATFGLAAFSDRDAELPAWASELDSDRLERLMLHPNYGLISDPRRQDVDLCFPFMVYEAKGWSGDCRVARRQACSAAAVYLDMLDHLARRPGQVGDPRPYQTTTSHHYQVFVLTSFGAYWHLLVGHRRPRQPTEHAGADGMSETVYLFQQLWSGHVIYENQARELLSLIDQIHLWAITEHRTFVLEHLRPWHQACEENYLLEWKSKYDVPGQEKTRRACSDTEDLMLPGWVAGMQESSRRDFQLRAKRSLADALQHSSLIKGKLACLEDLNSEWTCNACGFTTGSDTVHLDHLKTAHDFDDRKIAKIRCCIRQEVEQINVRARQQRGIMATGHRWPDYLMPNPFQEQEARTGDIVSDDYSKRRKISHSADPGPSNST